MKILGRRCTTVEDFAAEGDPVATAVLDLRRRIEAIEAALFKLAADGSRRPR